MGGYLRMFLDEGDPLRSLLHTLSNEIGEGTKDLHAYTQRLLIGFSAHRHDQRASRTRDSIDQNQLPARRNGLPLEPLSQREREVLRLLATYLTVPEIASRMAVSTSTARTHIKHIYGKLDVHTRIEAVERAKEMKLF